jgi:uncharacterized protein YycO
MRILFTATDTGFAQVGSRLIRAFEGGLASHCGAVLSDGTVVDASWPKGVATHSLEQFLHGRTLVADLSVPLPDERAAADWLLDRMGEPYDLMDIASFLLWRDAGRRDRYVCSGLIARALEAGGLTTCERLDRFGVRHLLIWSYAHASC